jgi:hypothetical protein
MRAIFCEEPFEGPVCAAGGFVMAAGNVELVVRLEVVVTAGYVDEE